MVEPLADRLAEAREHIDTDFGEASVVHGLRGLERRIVRRRRQKRAFAAFAVAALACVAFVSAHSRAPSQAPLAAHTVLTHDGSRAAPLSADAEIAIERDSGEEVALRLARGKGHFEVSKKPTRRYRVRAGAVEVVVLGTGFDVERLGARTRVAVDHGLVRVQWQGGFRLLHAGEADTFPPADLPPQALTPAAAEVVPEQVAPEQLPEEPTAGPKSAPDRWRSLARAGKHAEAFKSLGARPVEDLAGLLLAADAARLSSHPREAARFFERLVKRYPKSPEARLAAFTLGRLALNELSDPALAARSFGRAYALDPHGPLAEDALNRELEAYDRAGDVTRARSTARRYLERFPQGARRSEVARYLARQP